MRFTLSASILVSLVLALGTAPTAGAADKPASRTAMEKAAKKACITGDVRKGIDVLGDLFVETGDLTYVFNQGRCFQQNHRCEEAIDRFREYLRKSPDLLSKDRAEVNRYISDCEALQAKQAPPPAAPAAAPIPAALSAAPVPTAPAAAATTLAAAPASAAEQRGDSRLRTAGLVTVSVGVIALAGGVLCNIHANALTSDLNKPAGWDRGKASSRETYQTLGWWAGYGVGAAALATGVTLFVLGGHSGSSVDARPAVALAPLLLPGFASLSVRGSY
jgi:hypothetical protein